MCKHIPVNKALEIEANINTYTVLSIDTKVASGDIGGISILIAGSINCIYKSIQVINI